MLRIAMTLLGLACVPAWAQGHAHQPYAGQETRDIKSLSPEEVDQYLAGAGAGFAKPAELNHFPGPAHVLDLADRMNLTAAQREQVRRLMDSHKAEARVVGAKVVAAERDVEALFRRGNVGEAELADAVKRAALAQGEYRLTHLETHRKLRAILTPEQVAAYDSLRGYATGGHHHH